MKKSLKYIYIIIFFIISLAPLTLYLVNYFGKYETNANIEKNETKEFPKIYSDNAINDSFDDQCEEWLNQNIPFRGQLVSKINVVLSDVLKIPTSNVVAGKKGWIYSTETIDNYIDANSLSARDLQRIGVSLSLIQETIELKNGKFLFVPVPNKNSIYPEYMPNRYLKAKTNNLDRLYWELDKSKVNYLNLKNELLGAKEKNKGRLYYKKDTHWTALGAVVGYENIMKKIGREPILIDASNYSVKKEKRGDLDKLLFPMEDRVDEEYLIDYSIDYDSFEFIKPTDVADTKAQLENFMSDKEDHDNNFTTMKRKSKDNSNLYMVRDSFARAILPFMIETYDEATFIRSVSPSFEKITEGTDVIYEICERNLKNLIVSAPFMYAPERDSNNYISEIYNSDLNNCHYEDEGYALKICGTIDSAMIGKDGRVFVRLADNENQIKLFEAFPISESEITADNAYGYSLYIDKSLLNQKEYELSVLSGNYETQILGSISVNSNSEENSDFGAANKTNPYKDENTGHQLIYRDVTIGIGDNINDLKVSLGNQAAPSEIITSCLSGEDAIIYYYPNITIEADMEGNIYYISLMDNSYSDGKKDAVTESGITLGSDKMKIWEELGESVRENDKNCTYQTEHIEISYSYKDGKVTSVILEDRKYIKETKVSESDDSQDIPGVEYERGNAYLYDDKHSLMTGWQIIDGEYYFFDRISGEKIVGQTVDGIVIGENGEVNPTEYEKKKIETMIKAHRIVEENTNPTDTMEEKRRKVFEWIMSFPYHRYRTFKEVYNDEGIEIIEANDIFDEGAGDCVSESAALAFLFHEIGYNNVYWVHDTGHSWVRSDDKLYDPLFAESRDFDANYDAPFTDYRDTMAHSMLIY